MRAGSPPEVQFQVGEQWHRVWYIISACLQLARGAFLCFFSQRCLETPKTSKQSLPQKRKPSKVGKLEMASDLPKLCQAEFFRQEGCLEKPWDGNVVLSGQLCLLTCPQIYMATVCTEIGIVFQVLVSQLSGIPLLEYYL